MKLAKLAENSDRVTYFFDPFSTAQSSWKSSKEKPPQQAVFNHQSEIINLKSSIP